MIPGGHPSEPDSLDAEALAEAFEQLTVAASSLARALRPAQPEWEVVGDPLSSSSAGPSSQDPVGDRPCASSSTSGSLPTSSGSSGSRTLRFRPSTPAPVPSTVSSDSCSRFST